MLSPFAQRSPLDFLSGAGGAPAPVSPVNTVLPVISGFAAVGNSLSCSNGEWDNTPTSYTYQWAANGTPIGGAVAATYTLLAGQLGQTITVTVTAVNLAGSTPALSLATPAVVAASLINFAAAPSVGSGITLIAIPGGWRATIVSNVDCFVSWPAPFLVLGRRYRSSGTYESSTGMENSLAVRTAGNVNLQVNANFVVNLNLSVPDEIVVSTPQFLAALDQTHFGYFVSNPFPLGETFDLVNLHFENTTQVSLVDFSLPPTLGAGVTASAIPGGWLITQLVGSNAITNVSWAFDFPGGVTYELRFNLKLASGTPNSMRVRSAADAALTATAVDWGTALTPPAVQFNAMRTAAPVTAAMFVGWRAGAAIAVQGSFEITELRLYVAGT